MIVNQLPNLISTLRLAASPFLVWLLVNRNFKAALFLVAFAGVTDWLDGFAARHLASGSKIGVMLDPLADKIMLLTLFITLAYIGAVPLYLLALVIARDLVILVGAALLRYLRQVRTFLPTIIGKVSTFFQISYLMTVMLNAAFPNRLFGVLNAIGLISTVFFTIASGIGYVQKGIRLTRETAPVRT